MRNFLIIAIALVFGISCGEKPAPEPKKPEAKAEPAEKSGPSVSEHFPEKLKTPDGGDVSAVEALDGKMVVVYFSASWCIPCRVVTPMVVQLHKDYAGDDFEIVLLNFDYSAEEKATYIEKSEIPFPIFPGFNSEEIAAFRNKFRARAMPTLLVLSPTGELITKEGEADLRADPKTAVKKWREAMNR